jgi:FRG domain
LKEATGWIAELGEAAYAQPLAKMAYLQHHGIPTRLIDFTENPWMAVFFAAESNDGVDGRLFALIVEDSEIMSATPEGTPWRTYGTNVVNLRRDCRGSRIPAA